MLIYLAIYRNLNIFAIKFEKVWKEPFRSNVSPVDGDEVQVADGRVCQGTL